MCRTKDGRPSVHEVALSFSRHDVSFALVWRINLRNEEVGFSELSGARAFQCCFIQTRCCFSISVCFAFQA
jgi:hypothetical protein